MYKRIELKEGVPVQYLGIYATKWQPEYGVPEIGFVRNDYTLSDALAELTDIHFIRNSIEEADSARRKVEAILYKLAGEE